ncbi:acetylcholine receptor subunit beta-like 1 [Mya arenaria]|uniref:acetylcholine receptor subunit beta-like 1 n=1 Tax=Mya arenaria TaxID=6604 RepID=UPI0022E96775|nr:acetylcholine receptor subunit beta-like 1 [Mya arenaria]
MVPFLAILLSLYGVHCHSFEDEERLYAFVAGKTKPGIRPVLDQTQPVNVSVLPVLSELKELNSKDQTLKTSMALVLMWNQDIIHWNESDFGGADKFNIDARQIWTPDVNFQNRVDYGNIITDDADKSFKVTLMADGNVIWMIGGQLETSCTVDVSWYPFDNQECILKIATVTSIDPEIQLIPAVRFVHINIEVPNSEWTINESPMYKNALHKDRSVLKVHITLTRKSLSYIMNTIIPVFILSFMNVLSFKIPLQNGERISYTVSLFLSFMVLLNMVSDSIPNVSNQVSGLQLFVSLQLALGATVTSLSIALVKWSHSFANQQGNTLIELKELNAKDQTLKTSMALFLWWKQDLLRWNESDFGGADKITLNSRQRDL